MERERFSLRSVQGPRLPSGAGVPVFFDTGVTSLDPATHILGGVPNFQNPAIYHTFFNDFDVAADLNSITDTSTWDITNVGAGSIAIIDGDGGVAQIANAAADDNAVFIQKKGASFRFEPPKPLVFSARFRVNEAIQSDFIVGLASFGVVLGAALPAFADGIYFQKDDASAALSFHVVKGGTRTTVSNIYTVLPNTFLTVHFNYDGATLRYGVNGLALGSVPITNAPDTVDLTPTVGIQNGEAVVKSMQIDYVMAAKLR